MSVCETLMNPGAPQQFAFSKSFDACCRTSKCLLRFGGVFVRYNMAGT
jgi:hypothetical protein